MDKLIRRARAAYFDLAERVDDLNMGAIMPTLDEVPDILGIKLLQFDTASNLFDGMYGDVTGVTIWKKEDGFYAIGEDVEVFDENDYIRDLTEEEKLREETRRYAQAEELPDGWLWRHFSDGSGSLLSPEGESYFSYDKAPYHTQDGIEYKRDKDCSWSVFFGSFEKFIRIAENYVNEHVLSQEREER